jgi:hypothetical protein
MGKVHCMTLSSIHIHYNHDPVQAQLCTQRVCRERWINTFRTEVVVYRETRCKLGDCEKPERLRRHSHPSPDHTRVQPVYSHARVLLACSPQYGQYGVQYTFAAPALQYNYAPL